MSSAAVENLRKKKAEIEAQLRDAEERELQEKQSVVSAKIDSFSDEQKEFILSLMKHDRTSCSDTNPCNGFYYESEKWRCRKCMLMEIFNHEHGGCFDFHFTVDIEEVTP